MFFSGCQEPEARKVHPVFDRPHGLSPRGQNRSRFQVVSLFMNKHCLPDHPEIIVAVTSHNLEHCIRRCCDELFAQTYQDFHIVIYDDCSTDATRSILQEIQSANPDRLSLLLGDHPLGGPAPARNAVLDSGLLCGKYVIFLDGDDTIEPNFLEKLHSAAETNHADMSLCAYDRVEMDTGHVLCTEMQNFPKVLDLPAQAARLAYINGSLWNKLLRTDHIRDLRLPVIQVGEDLSFLLETYPRCQRIACVDEVLIHYQVRSASVISNTRLETIYALSDELYRLWENCTQPWYRDTLALVVFIHVGISLVSRIADNPANDLRAVIRDVSRSFAERYRWFRGCRSLHLRSLLRFGVKGLGLWVAKLFYRVGCFHWFIALYKLTTNVLHIDIKF